MTVALLFIDGVGIGRRDRAVNPLARGDYLLSQFDDGSGEPLTGGCLFSVDATFGVPGRPQSATNQTAIFTGQPAPAIIGKHVLGFPNAPLRSLLAQKSIVKRMAEQRRSTTFANCYPAGYLDALGLNHRPSQTLDVVVPPAAKRRLRPSATTLAMAAGGVELRTFDDARRDEGLTHDIDGNRAASRGFDVPRRTADGAADVFWKVASEADFALFEHYLADEAGHARDWEAAGDALKTFDQFARAVLLRRPLDAQVLICSDHGNVEDLSSRRHTLNRVPVLYFGSEPDFGLELETVADIGRAILRLMRIEP